MLDKLRKRKLYQSFLNGWDIIEEEEFIDEIEGKCVVCGENTNQKDLKVCNKCASEYKF